MSRYALNNISANITAPGINIYNLHRRRSDATQWSGTVYFTGTFGGGTVSLFWSPDQGTTLVPALDSTNTAITATTSKMTSIVHSGDGGTLNGDAPKLYVQVSGSTTPSLNVALFDNV